MVRGRASSPATGPPEPLHIGHYVGSIKNRIELQDRYECFFIIADLHTLTTRPERVYVRELAANIRAVALDYLATGIDPERSVMFVQSAVPETYELNTLLSMLTTVARLERVPSLKEMAQAAHLDACRSGCSATRCCRRPTSCCHAPTWCRWARTTNRRSK